LILQIIPTPRSDFIQVFFQEMNRIWIGRQPTPINFIQVFFQELNRIWIYTLEELKWDKPH
jgi:hypothetical protein